MRGRVPLFVLLGSALAFLVSLYLPWYAAPKVCNPNGTSCFGHTSFDGWSSGIGDAAALTALALAAATAAAIVRSSLRDRLPLGAGGLLAAYAGIATALLLRARPALFAPFDHHVHFHWAYGAYVGLPSALVAGISAATLRRRELLLERATTALASALGLALLVSFLLPWRRIGTSQFSFDELGILSPSAVLAAAMVALGGPRRRAQPLLLVGAAVFTLGGLQFGEPGGARTYGYWLALAVAAALLGVVLVPARRALRVSRLSLPDFVLAGAAALFLVSLFLRWQSLCFPHRNIAGTGPCLAANGWSLPGSTAAALACLVAVGALLRRYVSTLPLLAVGMGLFVTTAGLATGEPSGVGIHSHGSGAYLGFAATALFLAVVLSRRRTPPLDRGRLLLRLPPIAASLACVAAIAIAWWSVLPAAWERESAALSGWLSAAGLLFSLYLLWAWLNRARTTTKAGTGLVVAPLALLAALVLVLVENRDSAPTWGQGILVGLSVLLALFGWIELRRGLEDAGFSELLRVDRISEAEA